MGYLSLSLRSELNSSYMSSALRSVLRVICCDVKRTSTHEQAMTAAAASTPTMYCHHTVITSPGGYYTGLQLPRPARTKHDRWSARGLLSPAVSTPQRLRGPRQDLPVPAREHRTPIRSFRACPLRPR